MKTTTGSLVVRSALALSALLAASLAASCKSPLFGLGGQVDTAVPSISVSEVEEGGTPRTLVNGDYVRGTITLRGQATDDLGIASVSLSFEDAGASVTLAATIDSTAQTWSADVVTTDYLDGDKDFTVTVTDTAGKASTTRFVLYFDNKPPTVLLTVPAADEGTATDALYGTIDIKGSAADQFGIRKVRVYVYDSSKTLIYTSPDDASIGTNSFALRLDTSSMLGETGAEIGYVYVRAWDRSGNTNVQFYRLDEIKALNANQGATVEELHALETGSATSANGITLTQSASARRYQPGTGYDDSRLIAYSFDQSSNLPIITISNPEEGKTVNLLSKSAKAMGIVQDANGVALVELQFRSGAQVSGWYSDAIPGDEGTDGDLEVSGTGRVVNWSSKVLYDNFDDSGFGALVVATYDLRIRATDADGNVRTSDWVPFTIDADVPYVEILDPNPGDYEGGDPIVISGTAESYGTATVAEVAVSINGVFDYQAADIDPAMGSQNVTWSFDLTSALVPSDGTYTIKARVKDSGAKEALYNIVVTIDRTPPHDLAFSSPTNGFKINGYPVLRGQANDNILLSEVYLIFEKSGDEATPEGTYNWSYELDAGAFANTDNGYEVSPNIYRVPFRIRAVDEAGNESLSPSFGADPYDPAAGSYYLDVDLDGDYPEITTIISPGDENEPDEPYVITGSIKVQGTASDDDRLHSVEMALIALSGATESWRSLDSADLYDEVAADSFYPVTGTSLWSQVLNDGGELYALADLAGHAGDFKIVVRAVDTKNLVSVNPDPDLAGDEKTVYVRFDNTLPGVINILPEEGTMQSGTFPLTFTAQDNFEVVLAQISYNNGSDYDSLTLVDGTNSPQEYSFTVPVDTASIISTSGTLYMRIRLKDDGNNITEKSFKYLVDNIAPVNVSPPTEATVMNISNRMYTEAGASLAEILGTVKDTGTVRGIDYVEVYFERDGEIYKLNPDEAAVSVTAANYEFTNGSFPYTTDDAYKIIINKAENYVDVDGDGYQESLTEGTTGHTWGARFDSSKITDGDVTVHYVAWDQAGNSSHFAVSGAVKNNPPVLTSITLGTNLNDDTDPADATDDGERVRLTKQADGTWRGYTLKADGTQLGAERAYDLDDPVLTVRNNLFTFAATVSPIVEGGDLNTPLSYRALAPNGTAPLLDWVAASSYAVTDFGINGWMENAVNTLTIQARDSAIAPLATEELSFLVSVDNIDGTAPLISLAPVGTRYTEPAASQSLSYAARTEAAVAAYSDNLLWVDANGDTICSWDERLGHVELPSDSLYDELDADVSGTIKLRGKAYDDQRISRITAAFSVGFDTNGTTAGGAVAAGTEIELAAFSGGALSVVATRQASMDPASNTLAFALDGKNAPELSDELGHVVNYTLTWNTAFITGVAEKNIVVTIRAYNVGETFSTTATQTVDVVPYIRSIARSTDYNTIRSKHGRYAASIGETLTIEGFNIWRNSSDTIAFGSATAVTISSGSASSFDVDVPTAARSGPLTVTVNGIASINNVNADTAYSTEASAAASIDGSTLWDDDRYMHIWKSDDATSGSDRGYFTGSADPEYPAMTMDPSTGILYASWSNYASSDVLYGTNGGGATTIYHSYDPLEHTDIDYGSRPAVAYNANTYGNGDWDQEGAGGVQIWDANAPASYDTTNWMGNPANSGYSFYGMEELFHDEKLMQFINQRIVTFDGANQISYYDTDTKALKYAYVANGSTNRNENQTWINIDGGSDTHDGTRITATGRSNAAGEFSAIDTTPGGLPVIAYYDVTNQTVKLARASAVNPAANQWALQEVMDDETVVTSWKDSNYRYSGKYISLKIDAAGYAHIAFYRNSTGDLIYIKSTNNPTNGTTAYLFGPSVIVDEIGSVGIWADLTIYEPTPGSATEDDARPIISYLDSSLSNTFDGVKVAYWDPALERASETLVSGATDSPSQPDAPDGWETMNAPMRYEVENVRTSVEYYNDAGTPPDSAYSIRIGYSSTDFYRIGYYVKD